MWSVAEFWLPGRIREVEVVQKQWCDEKRGEIWWPAKSQNVTKIVMKLCEPDYEK